jgi:SAM-dependent methyltransferase
MQVADSTKQIVNTDWIAASSDPIGVETLRRMASVDRYNHWIFDEIKAYAGQRMLEVGCGIGNMTAYFLDRQLMVALDLLPESVALVHHKYGAHQNVIALQGDITNVSVTHKLQPYALDTVICLNVLEHIPNDLLALQQMYQVLQPAGRLLLVVPAGKYLYGTLDHELGHQRRYERQSLRELVMSTGFSIDRLYYINLAGVLGWFVSSRILRHRILPRAGLKGFNIFTPLFISVENTIRSLVDVPWGQSLVCIARRP